MLPDETHNPWTTIDISEVYDNPWITVTHETVITPGKSDGFYGKVHFKNLAIGIIPLDDDYNTWIVGQYRYPLNEFSWEIPEGGSLIGKNTLDTAKKELLEETGIKAKKWTEILHLSTSNSVTDEKGICYLAQNLSFGLSSPEDTEELYVRKLPFNDLVQMVMDGKIEDSISIAAILKLKLLIDKGEI